MFGFQSILTHFQAATAVIEAKMAVLVTLPPKAPPRRLMWQETRLDGIPKVSATDSYNELEQTNFLVHFYLPGLWK